MDKQDGQDTGLKHEAITKAVIGCAFEVISGLGAGFLEPVCKKALLLPNPTVRSDAGYSSKRNSSPIKAKRELNLAGVLGRTYFPKL
jgi:hypothetical protein